MCYLTRLRKQAEIKGTTESSSDSLAHGGFQEKMLCVLKYYKSGRLEVSPGFSEYERRHSESSDCVFLSSTDLLPRRKGLNISTFYFTTSQGVNYQYTLTWHEYVKDIRAIEDKDKDKVDEDFQKKSAHRKEAISKLREISPFTNDWMREENILLLELVSASKFYIRTNESLFARYEIILSRDWVPLCETKEEVHIGSLSGTTKKARSLGFDSLLFGTGALSMILFFLVFKVVRI